MSGESEETEKCRYKSSENTCGKREKWKSACINRASVPAESGRSGKAQVQTERGYLRKVREVERRMYKPSVCTCGKREKRKSARTNQASVPAVSVRGGKRMYKPGTYTCENMDAGKYGHNLDSLTLSVAEKIPPVLRRDFPERIEPLLHFHPFR